MPAARGWAAEGTRASSALETVDLGDGGDSLLFYFSGRELWKIPTAGLDRTYHPSVITPEGSTQSGVLPLGLPQRKLVSAGRNTFCEETQCLCAGRAGPRSEAVEQVFTQQKCGEAQRQPPHD